MLSLLFVVFIAVQAFINLIGALGPELGFDALWYHLPLARLMIERNIWGVIPGELLFTSGLPRLLEVCYALLLGIGHSLPHPEVLPKLLHYGLGLISAYLIYRIAQLFWTRSTSLASAALWYSNLVVGWQSVTAYVDLGRTAALLAACWAFILYYQKRSYQSLIFWALGLTLAYSIKIMSGYEIALFGLLELYFVFKKLRPWRDLFIFSLVSGSGIVFWGLVNYGQGYAPLYPFFSSAINLTGFGFSHTLSWRLLLLPFDLFFNPANRTGPVIPILVLISINQLRSTTHNLRSIIHASSVLSIGLLLTGGLGDGRYALPFLAILSILAVGWLDSHLPLHRNFALGIIILQCTFGLVYRGVANAKFIPVLAGQQSWSQFLLTHLNFGYGEYYNPTFDPGSTPYLVYGIHNLYYLPGTFDHITWANPKKCYSHVLTTNDLLPHLPNRLIPLSSDPLTNTTFLKDPDCVPNP